jgi:AcrR family transcriptional regulator
MASLPALAGSTPGDGRAGRMSADQRREQVLAAALAEFARGGLAGTSTEAIAVRAGISQPYLFRLFGSKRELFLAAVRRCFANVSAAFAAATRGLSGDEALQALGRSYDELLADRETLLVQLHTYAACDDPVVRDCVRDGFRMLYEQVQRVTGAPPERMVAFFAAGMLANVVAALQLGEVDEPWAVALRDYGAFLDLGC